MKKISVYLRADQITRLQKLSSYTKRTLASHIREAIWDHLSLALRDHKKKIKEKK